MASQILQRMMLAFRHGLQFDGARDLYAVYGYKKYPKFEDYLAKYVRQDIASRVVDAPAQAVWRNPPEIKASAEFVTKWKTLEKKNKIYYNLERVDKLAGIGAYSTLLVGFDDQAPLESPVERASDILYLQPYSQLSASVLAFNEDSKDPRYNMPEMYELQVVDPSSALNLGQVAKSSTLHSKRVKVHYTRMLHVAESVLEDEVLGIPRLQKVFNLLDDLIKIVGGAGETFWLNARQGLQMDVDKDMDLSEPDAAALADEAEEFQHQLRRIIRTRGVTMKSLGSDVADPRGSFDVVVGLISGATGIPRRILLGSEAGQLASEQDRANWAERVFERRGSFAEPTILEPFIDMLNVAGVLPQGSADVEFEWPSAFHLSPLEKAQTSAQQARSVANLAKQGTKSSPMVITTEEEAREIVGLPAEGGPKQPNFGQEEEGDTSTGEELDEDATEQLEDDAADGPTTNIQRLQAASGK